MHPAHQAYALTRWLVAFSLLLSGCLHPITRANELLPSEQTQIYANQLLHLKLQLYGDYELNLRPRNQMDALTKPYVKHLGLRRSQRTLLFTGRTFVTPTFLLRALWIRQSPDWAAKGFRQTTNGRYLRSTTVGTDLRLEYAVALTSQQGWLYLLAVAPAPTASEMEKDLLPSSLTQRQEVMEGEFERFIFPSVEPTL